MSSWISDNTLKQMLRSIRHQLYLQRKDLKEKEFKKWESVKRRYDIVKEFQIHEIEIEHEINMRKKGEEFHKRERQR